MISGKFVNGKKKDNVQRGGRGIKGKKKYNKI